MRSSWVGRLVWGRVLRGALIGLVLLLIADALVGTRESAGALTIILLAVLPAIVAGAIAGSGQPDRESRANGGIVAAVLALLALRLITTLRSGGSLATSELAPSLIFAGALGALGALLSWWFEQRG